MWADGRPFPHWSERPDGSQCTRSSQSQARPQAGTGRRAGRRAGELVAGKPCPAPHTGEWVPAWSSPTHPPAPGESQSERVRCFCRGAAKFSRLIGPGGFGGARRPGGKVAGARAVQEGRIPGDLDQSAGGRGGGGALGPVAPGLCPLPRVAAFPRKIKSAPTSDPTTLRPTVRSSALRCSCMKAPRAASSPACRSSYSIT